MCADFVAPQIQYPDFLRSAALGQQMGQQAVMFPYQVQQAQQQTQQGALTLQQLQMAIQAQQMWQQAAQRGVDQDTGVGTQSTQTGQTPGGPTGGIQNGPQGAVSSPSADQGSTYGMPSSPPSLGLSPGTITALSFLPGAKEHLAGIQSAQQINMEQYNAQVLRAQMRARNSLAQADMIADSPSPKSALMHNGSLLAQWPDQARAMGFDPDKDFDDQHVGLAALTMGNQIRNAVKLPPRPMPEQVQPIYGANGQLLTQPVLGGKPSEITPQKLPTYAPEIGVNPDTGQRQATMLETSPGGSAAPSLMGGGGSRAPAGGMGAAPGSGGGVGSVVRKTDIGYAPQSAETDKAATFASLLRGGMQNAVKLEQQGVAFTPYERTVIINGIASEGGGGVVPGSEALSQYLSQKATVNFSPEKQEYLASILPMIQASVHSLSGVRITPGTIRADFDKLIPLDPTNSGGNAQVNRNRDNLYRSQLNAAGSSALTPVMPELRQDLQDYRSGKTPSWLTSAKYQEGQTAMGPGGRLVFKGGQWVPAK